MSIPQEFGDLLNAASKLGARGYEVVGWIPPTSGSSDPMGTLVVKNHNGEALSARDLPWYER